MDFIKRNWKWLLVGGLILAFGYWRWTSAGAEAIPEYVTEVATQRDVLREVSVTGTVVAAQSRNVTSIMNESVAKIMITEGDVVAANDALLQFDDRVLALQLAQARGQLAQAQAGLDQQRAGATVDDITVSEKDVEAAQVALRTAEKNLVNVLAQQDSSTQSATLGNSTAQTNLRNAQIQLQNTIRTTENDGRSALAQLQTSLKTARVQYATAWADAQNTQTLANSVLLRDDSENEAYAYGYAQFGTGSKFQKNDTQNLYITYKAAIETLQNDVDPAAQPTWNQPSEALDYLQQMADLLDNSAVMARALVVLIEESNINTRTSFAVIQQAKADAQTQERTVLGAISALENAMASVRTAQLRTMGYAATATTQIENARAAVENAQLQLQQSGQNEAQSGIQSDTNVTQAQAEIDTRTASLARAQAALAKVKNGPRAVDLGAQSAGVQIAQTAVGQANLVLSKATVTSPISGVVTAVYAKVGERPSGTNPLMVVQSQTLEITADVPETDIGDIALDQRANVTFDAFGSRDIYTATITKKAVAETVIQGVIYYEITLQFTSEQTHDLARVLSGMTADIDLEIDKKEDVFAVEPQAVRYGNGAPHVRVITRNEDQITVEMRPVTLGLEGNTYIEIAEGITENDEIILFEELSNSPF